MLPEFSFPVKRFRTLLSGVTCFLSCLFPAETYSSTDHLLAADPVVDGTSIQCPPENTVVEAQNQAEVNSAFSEWLAQFTHEPGCESVTFLVDGQVIDILNLAPPDFCGDSLSLTFEASCDGQIISCERKFVTRPVHQEIVISLPVVDFSCFTGPEIPDIAELLPAYTLSYLINAFAILPACIEVDQLEMNTTVQGPFVNGKEVTYLRTYLLSAGGVPFEPAVHVLTFTYDPNPPVLIGLPDDMNLKCGSPVPEWPVVSALDPEDGQVEVMTRTASLPCGGLLRTWEAQDACGNGITHTQRISFSDDEPPRLTVPADTIIACGEMIPQPFYQASDHCSSYRVDFNETVDYHNSCEYTLTRVWTAIDQCYNVAKDTQIIRVVDTIPPVITPIHPSISGITNGGELIRYGCDYPRLAMSDVRVTDNCCEVTYSTSDQLISSNGCGVFGYYHRWKCSAIATDAAGNQTEFFFYVLQYDTVAPLIYSIPDDLELDCGEEIPPVNTTVYAEDNCSPSVSVRVFEETTDDPENNQMIIRRTWEAIDDCGNLAQASQTIRVCTIATELTSFEITTRQCQQTISWSTSGESGLEYFTIQYSADGHNFKLIREIKAGGTYSFTDPVKRSGGYYRISLVFPDGTEKFSEEVPVTQRCFNADNLTIYPNPFREFINLYFRAPDTDDARISIYDQFGRSVYTETETFNQGLNEKQLKTGHLPSGLYRIEITTSHYSEGQMIIRP
jgi:hypothetical protein